MKNSPFHNTNDMSTYQNHQTNHLTRLGAKKPTWTFFEELLRSGSSSSFLEGRFSVWIPNGGKIQEGRGLPNRKVVFQPSIF